MKLDSSFKPPPYLMGYNYPPEEAYDARNADQLLSMRIETSRKCNLRCIYCNTDSGEPLPNELGFDETIDVISQGKELGVKSIVIIGAGEPTIYPNFRELIEYIYNGDMIPVIFTNTTLITEELAKFLYEKNTSVITKIDSLKPDIQDFLTDKKGAYQSIQKGLQNLIKAGFTEVKDPTRLRLGASFVTNKANIHEIKEIWKFCRDNNIYPNQEILTPNGRGKNIVGLIPSRDELRKLKLELLEMDRKDYGYDWLPYSPLTGLGCLQFLYSVYVTVEGYVRPCAAVQIRKENIREKSLRGIIETEFFQLCRHIDKHLKGKCGNCKYLNECIGCRGITYTIGVNANKDPLEAICDEDPFCFRDNEQYP